VRPSKCIGKKLCPSDKPAGDSPQTYIACMLKGSSVKQNLCVVVCTPVEKPAPSMCANGGLCWSGLIDPGMCVYPTPTEAMTSTNSTHH
jgi:hypothetical protein